MATAIAAQTINGAYVTEGDSPQISALTWTAADITGNTIVMPTGRVLLLFLNSGASTRTISVTSSADPYGRLGNIAATNIAAGVIFGRIFQSIGWEQTLGGKNLLVTANNAEVLIAAINI